MYAQQGIPFFRRIDGVDESCSGPRLEAFLLDPTAETYRPATELGPGGSGEVAGPWPVTVDMAELALR